MTWPAVSALASATSAFVAVVTLLLANRRQTRVLKRHVDGAEERLQAHIASKESNGADSNV